MTIIRFRAALLAASVLAPSIATANPQITLAVVHDLQPAKPSRGLQYSDTFCIIAIEPKLNGTGFTVDVMARSIRAARLEFYLEGKKTYRNAKMVFFGDSKADTQSSRYFGSVTFSRARLAKALGILTVGGETMPCSIVHRKARQS